MNEKLLTYAQVAAMARIKYRELWEMVKRRQGPRAVSVARQGPTPAIRFRASDVQRWLKSRGPA